MKKFAGKLTTLLALVALLVTGIVFAVSAEGETERDTVTSPLAPLKNLNLFSGQRTDAKGVLVTNWETSKISDCLKSGNLPSGVQFWPSFDAEGNVTEEADSLWFDFEYYYDQNVKSEATVRMRGVATKTAISISNGKITFPTTGITSESLSVSLPSYGWHHIALRYTQETVVTDGAVVDKMHVGLYLNGEYRGDVVADNLTHRLYTSTYDASKPNGVAYSTRTDNWTFSFYGNGVFYKTATAGASLIRINNAYVSFGTDPRTDYAPILIGDAADLKLKPNATIEAKTTEHTSEVVNNPDYPTYDVVEWKNYYDRSADLSSISLPELVASDDVIAEGWYSDVNCTEKITKLSEAAKDGNGKISVYARYVKDRAQVLDKWYLFPSEYYNVSGDLWQGGYLGENLYEFSNGERFVLDFDYYHDAEATTIGTFEIRLRRINATTAPFRISAGKLEAFDAYFKENGSSKEYTQFYDFEESGWYHLTVSMMQTTDEANGYTHSYALSVSVNGGEERVFHPTASAVRTYWEDSGKNQLRLYENVYDEDGNWTGYARPGAGRIKFFFYGSNFYLKNDGSIDTREHMLLVRNVHVGYGFGNSYSEMIGIAGSELSYELNGGKMPTESFDSANADKFSGGTYTPLRDGDGNTLVYEFATNKVYYSASSTYVLPIPTKVGQSFAGWYLNADFSGDPVTDTSTLSGDVTLYAKFIGGDHTVTLEENGTTTVYENCTSITLPATVEYWISNGELIAGGTTVALSGDATFIALSADLLTGASIRLREQSGVRFHTAVSKELLAALSEMGATSYKLGTLITVSDLLSGKFTADALTKAGIPFVELTSNDEGVILDDDGKCLIFYASIVDIIEQNFTRKFTAISYLEYVMDGKTYRVYTDYNSGDNTRSVYDVAKAANADTTATYTDTQKAQLKTYIDGVLTLNVTLSSGALSKVEVVAPYTGYASVYAVSFNAATATITLTKPADTELVTVVLNTSVSEIYTSGWTVSEDGTTVTIRYGTPTATE